MDFWRKKVSASPRGYFLYVVIIIIIIIILRHPGPFRAFALVQLKSWWRMGSIYLF
jgi:hypothetical protein